MRICLVLLLLGTTALHAQPSLQFNKRVAECEDRWVVYPQSKDSSYPFGFIYMDAQAGLTLNYEGSFRVGPDGKCVATRLEKAMMKYRLQPNNLRVALLPEDRFAELQVEARPDWLKFYKHDTTSANHFYRWGYLYNGLDECATGLSYLEKARQMDPDLKGLAVELAFSYNCLEQYGKAITVLEGAIAANPNDAYVHKELIYALIKSGQPDKALSQCRKTLETLADTTYHAENCYNLLASFYEKKDKASFSAWLETTRKWTANNERLKKNVELMEERMKQ